MVNPVVKFGRCFLKYPYQQMVTLINDNDLSACYGVLPQVCHLILPLSLAIFMGLLEHGRRISGLDNDRQL